jgi:O-antigen/teichoic acid export membrane protein
MEQRQLLRDSLLNVSASVLSAVLGLVTIPLFVTHLPTQAYADWIVTLATSKTVQIVDFGLGWTIVHVIAAEGARLRPETRMQMRSAATFVTALAIGVALVSFVAVALQFGDLRGYRLSIVAAGAVLGAASHLNNYSMGVLWGLRRFDLAGPIIIVEAALHSGGIIVLLLSGCDVVTVAWWETAVVATAALAKIIVADRLCPDAAFRPLLTWPKAPLGLVRFGIASQISDGLAPLFWYLGVVIVAQIAGPAAVIALHVGQKVPLAVAGFVTHAAEVTMPAASGLVGKPSDSHATVAVASARIAVALSVPAIVTIWTIAGPFMKLWVGTGDMETMTAVMRIAAAAVAAHSLGESARHFLWGSGRLGTIIAMQTLGASVLAAGAVVLFAIGQFDAVSFSALQAVAVGLMAITLSAATAGRAGLTGLVYAGRVARGIPLAAVAALAVGVGLSTLLPGVSWLCVVLVATGVTVTFLGLMVTFGLEPEEALALRKLVRLG